MSYGNIQASLDTQLQTIVGLPTLQLENTRNIARTGASFTRATLLPAQPRALSVGTTGKDELNGLYQIDVFIAQDLGAAAANTLADSIIEAFPRGLALDQGGTFTHIRRAWRQPGGRIEMFYQVPVLIQWTAIV